MEAGQQDISSTLRQKAGRLKEQLSEALVLPWLVGYATRGRAKPSQPHNHFILTTTCGSKDDNVTSLMDDRCSQAMHAIDFDVESLLTYKTLAPWHPQP